MKRINLLIVLVMMFVIVISLTACGSSESTSSDVVVNTPTPAPETVEAVLPTARANESVNSLIGNWIGTSSTEVAEITDVNGKLQYKDKDGTYPSKYKAGILTLTLPDKSTADVYIDKQTGHMMLKFGENIIEFKKK